MTTFQCPNGFFLSQFSSAYDGSERFYKFGCSRFSNIMSFDEECSTTETASTENGDMYLSCGSDQYTVGVEIIEDVTAQGIDSWQLLCCRSEAIKIRIGDCVDTKFINDYRRASTFSSSAQVIRRWQAMPENGDRRWWLQLCPIDLIIKKPRSVSEIRARRQLPWEWSSRGRFPATIQEYNPMFMDHLQQEDIRRRKLFESTNRVQQPNSFSGSHFVGNNIPMTTPEYIRVDQETVSTTIDMPKLIHQSRPTYRSRVHQFNEKIRSRVYSTSTIPTTPKPAPPRTSTASTTDSKPVEALDYYDMYDEKFDKKKHTEGGLLRGVSDFLQNIQDGLTLAQAAFPADNGNFQMKIAVTPPTPATTKTNLMFSNDDESLQIGPFVQQFHKKEGPMPEAPTSSTAPAPKREMNSIEGMLQMFGLCQGHPEL
uniref:Uncharacterized protein n=1 Tax=Ditylenchus dipsaci TaxID=166011 RepID=A0A915EGE1_9BILA